MTGQCFMRNVSPLLSASCETVRRFTRDETAPQVARRHWGQSAPPSCPKAKLHVSARLSQVMSVGAHQHLPPGQSPTRTSSPRTRKSRGEDSSGSVPTTSDPLVGRRQERHPHESAHHLEKTLLARTCEPLVGRRQERRPHVSAHHLEANLLDRWQPATPRRSPTRSRSPRT